MSLIRLIRLFDRPRHRQAQGLRSDDVPQGLAPGQADREPGFPLSLVDAEDRPAHGLREIGRDIQGQRQDARGDRGELDADARQPVVQDEDLHQQWRPAEGADVDRGDLRDHRHLGHPDHRDAEAEDQAQDHRYRGEQHGIHRALEQEGPGHPEQLDQVGEPFEQFLQRIHSTLHRQTRRPRPSDAAASPVRAGTHFGGWLTSRPNHFSESLAKRPSALIFSSAAFSASPNFGLFFR